jgi:hypothetical protein
MPSACEVSPLSNKARHQLRPNPRIKSSGGESVDPLPIGRKYARAYTAPGGLRHERELTFLNFL